MWSKLNNKISHVFRSQLIINAFLPIGIPLGCICGRMYPTTYVYKDLPAINSPHLTTTENFTDVYFSLLTTLTLRNTITETRTFHENIYGKFLFCQNSFSILNHWNLFTLVLPVQTHPLLIKLLHLTKMIRHLLS